MKKVIIFIVLSIYALSYDKVALIIGNENYENGSLRLPSKDAREVGEFLEKKGFKVIPRYNLTFEEMEREIDNLPNQVSPNGILLFYYSGHGSEVDKKNYLIPIDNSSITSKIKLKHKSVKLDYLIETMQTSQSKINIVMIDACRNDPFNFDKGSKGLIAVPKDRLKNTFLVFAGAEKTTIPDNGFFRKMFIKYADKPLSLGDLFSNIRREFSINNRNGIYTDDRTQDTFKFTNGNSSNIVVDNYRPDNSNREIKELFKRLMILSENRDIYNIMKYFDNEVLYYGKYFSKSQIRRDKSKYLNRWDSISYKISEIDIEDTSNSNIKKINLLVDFDLSNNKKRVYGKAGSTYKLNVNSSKIVYENSKVIHSKAIKY